MPCTFAPPSQQPHVLSIGRLDASYPVPSVIAARPGYVVPDIAHSVDQRSVWVGVDAFEGVRVRKDGDGRQNDVYLELIGGGCDGEIPLGPGLASD